MRQPLREKLQNAINRALLPDNDLGALIVGGRRRNRKKKVKNKNGTKNKKNAKKTEGKSKKHGGGFLGNKDDSGHESDPLIEEEEAEDWSDNQQLVRDDHEEEAEPEPEPEPEPEAVVAEGEEEGRKEGEEDPENLDPDKMPFGLFKKSKKDKKEKKDKKKDKNEKTELVEPQGEENKPVAEPGSDQAAPQQFKEGTTLAAMASTLPKKPDPVREWEHEFDSPDGGYVPASNKYDNQSGQPAVKEKSDPEKPVDQDETELKKLEVTEGGVKDGVVKSENSPLIMKNGDAKESKLQDQQPGMLCCTIL